MTNQFSEGLELASVLVTSAPVHQAWDAIRTQKQSIDRELNPTAETLLYNETKQRNCTIITFTAPVSLQGRGGLISSLALKNKKFNHFEFLCNKSNPSFSINEVAMELFASRCDELLQLKTKLVHDLQITKSTSLIIITGHSMGGCVATLFTLCLLESLDLSKSKRPLCITFSSPFVGDEHLRKCVLEFSTWTSCFLNVVSIQDPALKMFLSTSNVYKPFGTLLLCSASGCACFENPHSILMLVEMATNSQSASIHVNYGQILKDLKLKALCKHASDLASSDAPPLQASIRTQLAAIFGQMDIDKGFIEKMKKHESESRKTKVSNASKRLNDSKIYMVYLEWYKKESKGMNIVYYDRYKKGQKTDIDVKGYKKRLSNYWEDEVAEAENKPQKEGASFRTRWLMAGTNYRRMMEPLHIAEYYKAGKKDYTQNRPKHFILLEQWLEEAEKRKLKAHPRKSKADNVASSLNDDSCFWAHVEEALLLCNEPTITQDARQKLIEFEGYVLDALKNFAVSPEIFLNESSFMTWWKKYKVIIARSSYSSKLTDIMKHYSEYKNGVQLVV